MGDEPPAKRRLLQQIANMTEEEAAKVGALLSSSASAQPTTMIVNNYYGGSNYIASRDNVVHNSMAANQAYKQAAFGQTTLRLSGLNPPKNPASTFINVSIARTSSRTRRA